MRKLIVTEFISVDGTAEVEKLPGVAWNDEMQKIQGRRACRQRRHAFRAHDR
ncbi:MULTISPECIES: hypothetical protein [unclassified Mesorhizobium]|uniref:hypothetical protein n=1 Tax=unclassified Mesorhizobium TaxID=325217 RepID=UPI001FD8F5EC|nr:hypothetical protein [Mesorhizobium sp. LSHC420B00]